MKKLQLGPSLAKGRVGEIILAHHLGHNLKVGGRGADGIGPDGRKYEYKVSHDDQFNFNFGHARPEGEIDVMVKKHFDGFEGSYCALMDGPHMKEIWYCAATTLVPYLCTHLRNVTGSTFQKVFSPIRRFGDVNGAVKVYPPPGA
jgi:hypothetical protein